MLSKPIQTMGAGRRSAGITGSWYKTAIILIFALRLGDPDLAYAFQSHPAPEGLYVHQLAHVFFLVAMAILVYWLEKNHFTAQRGWRLIQASCILFALWNATTVVGHTVEELMPSGLVLGKPDWTQSIVLGGNPVAMAFYVLKLDHFVSVPAMLCLFLGIRSLYKQALTEERRTDG